MPNGRGSLECCVCIHYQGKWSGYDAFGEEGYCDLHNTPLPASERNRICSQLAATEDYYKCNPVFEVDGVKRRITPEERFSWFEIALETGILYTFYYNDPKSIEGWLRLNGKREMDIG